MAATVNAWKHRSGASAPHVDLTTRDRVTPRLYPRRYLRDVELFFEGLLVLCTLAILLFSAYVIVELFKGQN